MAGPAAPIIAGAVQGGMSIGGQLIAGRQSKKNMERTIAANKEQAEYAYAKDREMWEAQNAYNSPEAQMARLKAAGLNPNLVYGSGTVGNTSAPGPKFNPPTIEYNQKPMVTLEGIPNILSVYQDFQMRQAQIDNLRAQEENTRARTITESFRSTLTDITGQSGKESLRQSKMLFPHQYQIKASEAEGSYVELNKQWKNLLVMDQQLALQKLEEQYRKKQLTQVDIQNEKLIAEKVFQQYRNQWMRMGITTSDNPFIRVLIRMMNEAGITDYGSIVDTAKHFGEFK